jgi:hypothetical protein
MTFQGLQIHALLMAVKELTVLATTIVTMLRWLTQCPLLVVLLPVVVEQATLLS